jgi:hypothetical protein
MPIILTPTVPPTTTTTTTSGNYDNSKETIGGISPPGVIASGWARLEPLITAEQLRNLHLFGIPLYSAIKDPVTKKPQHMSDELIDEKILEAVALAEAELGMQIFPTQHKEKYPFDRNEYQSLGYLKLRNRPVASIEKFSVTPANEIDVFVIPNDWIDVGGMAEGRLSIIPINIALLGGGVSGNAMTTGGSWFLSILGNRAWISSFWEITYTTGFPNGLIPKMVNQLISAVAAMEVLSLLAATYARSTSHSMGIDSISQSISTPGPQLFVQRIQELGERKKMLIGKLKAQWGLKVFSNNV